MEKGASTKDRIQKIARSALSSLLLLAAFSAPATVQAQEKISPDLQARILSCGQEERLAVMVYFTDKGIAGKAELASALRERTRQLSARCLKRRAKMGIDGATYQDLAVSRAYVEHIVGLGARLRNELNWFNAASFEMTSGQVRDCSRLVFVDRIDILKSRQRITAPDADRSTSDFPETGPGKSLLNYGRSYRQNLMINAVVCHDSGYSGAGVLVAMFDNGFRKNHQAFDAIRSSGRLVDEWSFVSNRDTVDWAGHGTGTWSLAGGYVPGQLIGPAFGADWAIYHTEDNNQEMPIEEDHWAAALQRADLVGADVVSSSLAYRDFDDPSLSYTYQNLDGNTAISTLAARHAASLGIIVCNAMANSGPAIGTLAAPADADSILSVGATDSFGILAAYSSRGPTYDGRPKPEVCAQGTQTWWANWATTSSYSRASGTSCATPLVAGACALLLEAHPEWTPLQVREALMMTASRASSPDSSNYGWGVINVWEAMRYTPAGAAGNRQPKPKINKISCRPNPFGHQATVEFWLEQPGAAYFLVYDMAGREIFRQRTKNLLPGRHTFQWVPGKAASGVYFIRVKSGEWSSTTRAVLLR